MERILFSIWRNRGLFQIITVGIGEIMMTYVQSSAVTKEFGNLRAAITEWRLQCASGRLEIADF